MRPFLLKPQNWWSFPELWALSPLLLNLWWLVTAPVHVVWGKDVIGCWKLIQRVMQCPPWMNVFWMVMLEPRISGTFQVEEAWPRGIFLADSPSWAHHFSTRPLCFAKLFLKWVCSQTLGTALGLMYFYLGPQILQVRDTPSSLYLFKFLKSEYMSRMK